MTSVGTDALILAFTSKTGHLYRVTHTEFFHLNFSVRERIYLRILKAQFQAPDIKGSRERTKQRGIFAFLIEF